MLVFQSAFGPQTTKSAPKAIPKCNLAIKFSEQFFPGFSSDDKNACFFMNCLVLRCPCPVPALPAACPARPCGPFELVGYTLFFSNISLKGWAGWAANYILAATAPSPSARRGICRDRRASRSRVDSTWSGGVGLVGQDFAGRQSGGSVAR